MEQGAIILIAAIAMAGPVDNGSTGLEAAQQRRIVRLVADLRDDDVRWNAYRAVDELLMIGADATPALEDALWSEDWQQRQLAAVALTQIQGVEAAPSERLIEVCIEALRDDEMPWGIDGNVLVNNGRAAAHLLGQHIERSAIRLVDCLDSEDDQQRYVAALILGAEGQAGCAKEVCAILLPHLRDNDLDGDAVQASAALYRLGVAALPWLMLERNKTEAQAQRLIDELIRDITDPPDGMDEIIARARPRDERIGRTCHVPHLQVRRPYLLRWPHDLRDPGRDE